MGFLRGMAYEGDPIRVGGGPFGLNIKGFETFFLLGLIDSDILLFLLARFSFL